MSKGRTHWNVWICCRVEGGARNSDENLKFFSEWVLASLMLVCQDDHSYRKSQPDLFRVQRKEEDIGNMQEFVAGRRKRHQK
jgi:hypothetical protein